MSPAIAVLFATEVALKSCMHPGHGYPALFLYIYALQLSVPGRFPVHACAELGMMECGQDYLALRNVQVLMLEDARMLMICWA